MKASNKQTSECGMDRNSTEELIKQLENRLDRLTGQPAEEMNVEEIENILNLLDTLKPLPGGKAFNPEEAFERLERDYLDNPEKLDQASEEADRAELKAALREKAADAADSAERKTASGKHRRFRVLKNIGIAAAIMILIFSGLNLATYATARKGLFAIFSFFDIVGTSAGVSADTLNAFRDFRNAASISSQSASIDTSVLPAE